ncbi:acyltransferase family protein [Lelliottia nimipressuralis]|uniref:acyltransferase family protein n=1 Tax=Lelliottia nimipressuralis TaxID=69220 RepID=UPI003D2929C7
MDKKHFFALDSFRGLCALCVVVFHMRILDGFSEFLFFRNSRLFVEFFFILSGFVLTHSHLTKQNSNFKKYAIARTFRIFPLHVFMLCVYILLECLKLVAQLRGFEFNIPAFEGGNSIKELIPNLLLLQSWFGSFDYLSFNYPSWSISVEYYLYFVFFLVIWPREIVARYVLGFMFLLLFIALEFAPLPILTGEVIRGGICFGAGVVTYYIFYFVKSLGITHFSGYVFTLFEVFALLLIWYIVSYIGNTHEFLIIFVFSLSVFLFSFELGVISALLGKPFFQLLGKLSYSIYLTHAAILFIFISMAMVLQKITGIAFTVNINGLRYLDFGSPFINNLLILGVLSFVIFVSMFTYRYIELPGQKKGKELNTNFSV